MKKFAIGIDLGTTNCALAYEEIESGVCRILEIPQASASGQLENKTTLPSCCYLGTPQEIKKCELNPYWDRDNQSKKYTYAVGAFAYNKISESPERVIQSAKSWLSYADVDRTASILPWGSDELLSQEKISPIEASARYLRYLKDVWNHLQDVPFEEQDITITVPASFDEAAQTLTLEAAKTAGFPDGIRLLEEPQAAFYSWLHQNKDLPENIESILVCDIGGGTTDLSLFKVIHESKEYRIERVAVSNHILLGGDNIDLTLALALERKLTSGRLSAKQWRELVFQARMLKERVLEYGDEDADTANYISISSGSGSSLMNATMSASITRREINEILEEGFFPYCEENAKPIERSSGLKEFGLLYEKDTAITRHLASFLAGRKVDAVLLNGGTLKAALFQDRLVNVLYKWGNTPEQLVNSDMDLAVAYGAAHYGSIVQRKAVKIYGGYPRSVYVELQSDSEKQELLCVLPKGFEEGQSLTIKEHGFKLLVNQPVRFQIFTARIREQDKAGDIVNFKQDEFHKLPALQTLIRVSKNHGKACKVFIESTLTETGMLELHCLAEDGSLLSKLSFNLKSVNDNSRKEIDEQSLESNQECNDLILKFYGKGNKQIAADEKQTPKALVRELERIAGQARDDWSLPFLRSLWKPLSMGITRRNRSLIHECTWLNLTGFVLRPGYGAELDSFRINELWKAFEMGLAFPKEQNAQVQWAVMWRRVAGGLNREQQEALYKSLDFGRRENPELFRLAASLERIPIDERMKLGDMVVRKLLKTGAVGQEQFCWALGRIASRIPLYAGLNSVVPAKKVSEWFERLRELNWNLQQYNQLNNAFSLAARLTNDRTRDVDEETRKLILEKMKSSHAIEKQLVLVKEFVEFVDESVLFGEVLPAGLVKIEDSKSC